MFVDVFFVAPVVLELCNALLQRVFALSALLSERHAHTGPKKKIYIYIYIYTYNIGAREALSRRHHHHNNSCQIPMLDIIIVIESI